MHKLQTTLEKILHTRGYTECILKRDAKKKPSDYSEQIKHYLRWDAKSMKQTFLQNLIQFEECETDVPETLIQIAIKKNSSSPVCRDITVMYIVHFNNARPTISEARTCKDYLTTQHKYTEETTATLEPSVYTETKKETKSEANNVRHKLQMQPKPVLITQEAILISKEKLTPATLSTFHRSGCKTITLFQENELMVALPEHSIYQKSMKLSETESKHFLKNHKTIRLDDLPIMLSSDAAAKFSGWSIGDIIHITRVYGKLTQPTSYWRIVKPNIKFSMKQYLCKHLSLLFLCFHLLKHID